MSGAWRTGRWTVGASVVSALLASACCWLPLLLAAVGVSAAGVASRFEATRPWFLSAAALGLAFGFYALYFRTPSATGASCCETKPTRLRAWNRTMLWVASVAVAAIAFFPQYVGLLMRDARGAPSSSIGERSPLEGTLALRIEGMTCEACAIHIERELRKIAGVRSVAASYDDGKATLSFDASSPPGRQALTEAVERAGYRAHFDDGDE